MERKERLGKAPRGWSLAPLEPAHVPRHPDDGNHRAGARLNPKRRPRRDPWVLAGEESASYRVVLRCHCDEPRQT